MKTINKKQLRQVTILVRYFIKATGTVVLYVKNDKGIKYYTRLQKDSANSCSCPATVECYHIKVAINSEQARPFAAKQIPAWTVKLLKSGKLVAPGKKAAPVATKIATIITKAVEAKIPVAKTTDLSTTGNLNGQQGYALLR